MRKVIILGLKLFLLAAVAGLALGVTFPFNLLIGIPLAYTCIDALWR